jgi:hypothetical protein
MTGLYERIGDLRRRRASHSDIGALVLGVTARLRFEENGRFYRELGDKGYARREASRLEDSFSDVKDGDGLHEATRYHHPYCVVAAERALTQRIYQVKFIIDAATYLFQRRLSGEEAAAFIGRRFVDTVLDSKAFSTWQRQKGSLAYQEYVRVIESLRRGLNRSFGAAF